MNSLMQKGGLAAVVAVVTIGLAACGAIQGTCTVTYPAKNQQNFDVEIASLAGTGIDVSKYTALVLQASATAQSQGYTRASVVFQGASLSDLVSAVSSGNGSAKKAFQRVLLSNATLANNNGSAVLGVTSGGQAVTSSAFTYHVTDTQLVFDNPSVVDQWIMSNQGAGDSVSIGVPDLLIDTGPGDSQVSFSASANYASSELASVGRTWHAEKRACPRCMIN